VTVAWTLPPLEAAQITPSTFVVTASGALDDGSAVELRDILLPLAGADGSSIILDLGAVHDLGPASLDVISSAARLMQERGGQLTVIAFRPPLVDRFAECGLGNAVRVERTLQQGLAC
jgi:anti-anti-sigma factor